MYKLYYFLVPDDPSLPTIEFGHRSTCLTCGILLCQCPESPYAGEMHLGQPEQPSELESQTGAPSEYQPILESPGDVVEDGPSGINPVQAWIDAVDDARLGMV